MIIAKDWLWLHFPKAGGTSAEKILKVLFERDKSVTFDPLDPDNVIWHHSLAERREHDPGFDPGQRRVICNIRRLPLWILSRVHFEVQRSGAGGFVSRVDLVKGRFAIPNSAGTPELHQADEVLNHYAPGVTHWVRVEKMAIDLAPAIGLEEYQVAAEMVRENVGLINYIRHMPFWFTSDELKQIYAANPAWAALERKVYGQLWGE